MDLPSSWPELTPPLRKFYDLWQAARGNDPHAVPYRRQLGLQQLRGLTPSFVVLELVGPGAMRVKMSGTEIDAQFGKNLTGRDIHEMTTPEAGDRLIAFHEALIRHPCGGFAHDVLFTESGKGIHARYLILPMLNRDGERVLCGSLCDASKKSFALQPHIQETRITYTEFQGAQFLDIGFGLPDFDFKFGQPA